MARADGRDGLRRFFDVVVALDQTDPAVMRPGMSVRVEVVRRRAEEALLVPRAALRRAPRRGQDAAGRGWPAGGDEAVEVEFCTAAGLRGARRACVEGTAAGRR